MNRQKHKLPRRILAVLLMAAMLITMLPSAMFAAPNSGRGDGITSTSHLTESATGTDEDGNEIVSISKTANPGDTPGTWDITMTVQPKKDIQAVPLDVALVLDSSGSMAYDVEGNKGDRWDPIPEDEQRGTIVKGAARDLVAKLAEVPDVNIGVVDFDSNYDVEQNLVSVSSQDNVDKVTSAINRLDTSGGTNFTAALNGAQKLFEDSGRSGAKQVIILLTDGVNDGGSVSDAKEKAKSLKDNGATIYTIGFADVSGAELLKQLASSEDHFYPAENAPALTEAFTNISAEITAMVNDYVGTDVTVDEGSVSAKVNGTADQANLTVSDDRVQWNPSGDKTLSADDILIITYTVSLKGDAEDHWNNGNASQITVNDSVTLSYNYEGYKYVWVPGHYEGHYPWGDWIEGHLEKQWGTQYGSVELESLTDNVQVGKLVESYKIDNKDVNNPAPETSYQFVWGDNAFTWDTPENPLEVNNQEYTYEKTTLNGSEFTGETLSTPVTAGETKVVHYYTSKPAAPNKPSVTDLGAIVKVDCVNEAYGENGHVSQTFDLIEGNCTISDPVWNENTKVYESTVTVTTEQAGAYVEDYNESEAASGKTHELVEGAADQSVTFKYEGNKWVVASENNTLDFDVTCPKPLGVSSITKEVVTGDEKDNLPEGVQTAIADNAVKYPEAVTEGNPLLTVEKGTEVTLLYKITVSGAKGAGFSVNETEPEATLVGVVDVTETTTAEGALFTGTLDEESATLYVLVDYGTQNAVGTESLSNTVSVTNTDPDADEPENDESTETVDVEVTPETPDEETICDIFGGTVKIDCVGTHYGSQHEEGTYSLPMGGFTYTDPIKENDGSYYITITVDPNADPNYMNKYEELYNQDTKHNGGVTNHTIVPNQEAQILTLVYNNDKWEKPNGTVKYLSFEVTCPDPVYTIDGVDKFYVNDKDERAAAEEAGIKLDGYAFPSEEKVIVPNDGSAIKLLYGITVTGQKGATFTVKDTGAKLVEDQALPTDDADKALIGVVPGATDSFTGTIPDGGSVTFYVEKSFTKDDIKDGELLNTAAIIDGNIDPDNEKDKDTENVPAEEEKATIDSIEKFYVNPEKPGFNKDETSPAIELTKYAGLDEYGNIVIPENGTVTVLYGITLKGTPGASFNVMDDSASFVSVQSSDVLKNDKLAVSGASDIFEGTFPTDGEVTFYVSKIFDADDIDKDKGQITNTAEAKLVDEKDTIKDTETNNAIVEETVDIPDDEELIALIGDKITVDCVNGNVDPEHPDKVYGLVDKDHYTVSDLMQNNAGQPTFTVTLITDEYIADYSEAIGKDHKLSSDGDYIFSLTWDGNKWIVEPDEGLVIKVECEYGITGIDKFLVADVDQKEATGLSADKLARFTFPDEKGRINLPKDGKVTLLYGITVTGVAGEEFTVTDENALLTPDADVPEINDEPAVTNTDNGIFTGTIPEGGSITFYVEKVFTIDDVKTGLVENEESLVNVAEITEGDVVPGKEDDEEIVQVSTGYSLTYEANGGYFANDPAKTTATVGELNPAEYPLWTKDTAVSTIPVDENGKELAKPSHAQAAPPEDTVISDADLVDVELIGWTTEVPESAGQIYAAGDKYPTLTDKATIEDDNVIVYAVWGYDENNDGVADATQIVITPADITIYSGGAGYEGVLGEDGELVGTEGTQNGLPEPGYYFILPYQLNDKLGGATNIIDLSGKLHLDYVNQDDESDVRGWNLELYNKSNPEQSMAYGKYVYRLIPETTGYPVRLEIKDGDNLVSSDNFTISLSSLSKTYSMKLYTDPEVDRVQVTAQIQNDENDWVDANEALGDNVVQGIARGTATLTIRGTTEDQPVSAIQNTVAEEVDAITAVEPENVDYYINGSKIPVVMNESASNVQLLNDTIVNESGSQDVMENAIVSEAANDPDVNIDADYAFDFRYLDLVDTDNGNAYVTMGEGQEMTIYWPYPEGMDMNDTFYVAHFDGLDREFTAEELNTAVANSDLKLYHEGDATYELETTEFGIKFTTSSFSPFALVYDASQADDGDDNPPYYPWHPDGDDDGPSGLNTEDHFSYVVGYAEDYRTGEATDNEDLWPVKPNNQITRAEVATIFYRLLEDEVRDEYDTTTNDFSDVTADSWYNQTVSTLARMGIVKGYEDGTFRPNEPITRAEFGAIATRFFAETGATYEPGTFTDVTGDEWFANAIQDAVNLGLIGGYPDGTVRPNNNITRAEACAIVNRTLGRVPDADHLLPEDVMKVWPDNNPTDWFYADMQEATNGHEYAWIEEDGHEIEEWTNLLDKDWTDR